MARVACPINRNSVARQTAVRHKEAFEARIGSQATKSGNSVIDIITTALVLNTMPEGRVLWQEALETSLVVLRGEPVRKNSITARMGRTFSR